MEKELKYLKQFYNSHRDPLIFLTLSIFLILILGVLRFHERFTPMQTNRNMLGDFCNKMKLIDNNFIKNGDAFLVEKQMYESIIQDKKNKIADLIKIINKYQKGIYFDEEELSHVNNYNEKLNDKTKQQLKIVRQALKNLNSNLNPNIQIKI